MKTQEAQAQSAKIKDDYRRRLELTEAQQSSENEVYYAKRIKALLDKKSGGLQLYLLQEAEGAILNLANNALDALSAGTLELRLTNAIGASEASEQALDLVVYDRRISQTDAIGVEFTSGSQRFRIAVSLALAIGQFVAYESKRIESVIIDEGFGGLDKSGLDAMVDALDALKQQLKRIIVVSHQEEFASVFANKYLIKLVDGAARASLASN